MRRTIGVAALVVLALAGCGKSKDADGETQAGKACSAAPAALTGESGLPAGFPTASAVTYTATAKQGPSTVVTGYASAELADTFASWKTALAKDPFSVTKSEKDAHDAEVNFAGAGTTGQVKLGEECEGRTSVRVTVRPQ